MRSNEDTIPVPKRFIFIMIFVSLGINIFFLLMGILIGKEDLKWNRDSESGELPVQQIAEDERAEDSLEEDLSLFEPETDSQREAPINISELTPDKATYSDPPPASADTARPEPSQPSSNAGRGDSAKNQETQGSSPAKVSGYWVQVLASTERQKAQDFLGKLKAKGLDGVVFQEGGFYKVQVGPYNTRAIAEVAKKKIDQDFKTKSWIRAK